MISLYRFTYFPCIFTHPHVQPSVREKGDVQGRVLAQLGTGLLLSDRGWRAAHWGLAGTLMKVISVWPQPSGRF